MDSFSVRVQQDGQAIKSLRLKNGMGRRLFALALDGITPGFSVTDKSIQRWEQGENVQNPQAVWAAFCAAREKRKLEGDEEDFAAVGRALGQIEKGSEKRQQAEESQNPSQGIDSSASSKNLCREGRAKRLEQARAEVEALDFEPPRGQLNRATQLAYKEPLLVVWKRESPRMLLESFRSTLFTVKEEHEVDDLATAIAYLERGFATLNAEARHSLENIRASQDALRLQAMGYLGG